MPRLKDDGQKVLELIERVTSPELYGKIWKAAYFKGGGKIIRATLRRYGKKMPKRGPYEIALSFTKPNFEERKILKRLSKRCVPFFWNWSK